MVVLLFTSLYSLMLNISAIAYAISQGAENFYTDKLEQQI